ncbi:MAG: cation-transporting P-type ATPase, partial [Patescibacteria group bacterium]
MVFQPSQASTREVFEELNTSEKGLSLKEAEKRLKKFGPNELKDEDHFSVLKIFLSQFTNIMVLILIAAMCISLALGEMVDAVAIGAIVLINAVIGFIQEFKAEKALEALKKMAASF